MTGKIVAPYTTKESREREARNLAERNAKLDAPIACYSIAWTTVKGVAVQLIPGMEHIVAVPCNGKRNSARFDVIDLNANELLCQLLKSEVSAWLIAKAKSLDVPFNSVV